MDNFLLLIVCFFIGVGLRVWRVVDEKAPVVLNAIIIYVPLPALAILHVHSLPVSTALLVPASMAWLVFGIGVALFHLLGRFLGLDRKTVACLCLCCGLGNTSFVGLPMIEAFFGPDFIGVGMLCDTAGTFMALSVPGILLAARYSGQDISGTALIKKILFFPPFLAILIGFALQPVAYPDWLESILSRLGGTLAPLALLSVGMALRFRNLRGHLRELWVGLGYKLFAAPALMLALYMGVFGLTDPVTQVTVFEAAMGPMITGGIIAMAYGLRPGLAASLIGVGVPLSFATLPAWYFMLQSL